MDGLARALAAPTEIELGGKTYRVKGRILKHFAEIEQHMLSGRREALEVAKESLALFADNPAAQEVLLRTALIEDCKKKCVDAAEFWEWSNTIDGKAYCLWLGIRDEAPEGLTYKDVKRQMLDGIEAMVERMVAEGEKDEAEAQGAAQQKMAEKIDKAINQASGSDLRGNLTGSPPSQQETEVSESPSPGAKSSAK